MTVQKILETKQSDAVICVDPATRMSEAAAILAEKRIGSVVVSADGRSAVGILSERDIVRELAHRGAACLEDRVETHMTPDVQSCTLSDTSEQVMARMTEGRFRHMPVVENGQMVGLITLGDVVKARLTELSMEKNALEGMIMGF